MRGLYDIPTRLRRSTWYLTEGTYWATDGAVGTERPHLTVLTIDFLPDGGSERIRLVDSATGSLARQISRLLWLKHRQDQPSRCKVLLRRVERNGEPGEWDVTLSPGSALTISLGGGLAAGAARGGVDDLVEQIRPFTSNVDWPEWIPNDEAHPTVAEEPPADIDIHLWRNVRDAILNVFPLEQDQVFWNLELERLEPDSMDIIVLSMGIEERLGIELSEDQVVELGECETVGDVYRFIVNMREGGTDGSTHG